MAFQNVSRELIRSGFVRAFRTAFESNQDFQYRSHESDPYQPAEDSGIFIYDAWPWKKIGYPAIIVLLGGGDPLLRTMGGEFKSSTGSDYIGQDGATYTDLTAETYGGGIQTTVRIHVYARSAIERSKVMDWINIYIRYLFVSAFEKEGVTVSDMSQAGEGQLLVGNDPVYTDSVDVAVYSEFEHSISTAVSGTIRAVSLTNLFTILPAGASIGESLS